MLKWMNVCRINFAYVCDGVAARSFPRGKLKANQNVVFFDTLTEEFSSKATETL